MRRIGGMFGRSASGPLAEQASKVRETVEELPGLIEAFMEGDRDTIRKAADRVDRLEAQTDDVKDEIRANLSGSVFSSVERSEVLVLVKLMDAIADSCQLLAKRITMRDTPFIEPMRKPVDDLVQHVVKSVYKLSQAVMMMRDMEEQGISRADLEKLDEAFHEVAYEEYLADQDEHASLEALFENEDQIDPVSVIFLMDTIGQLGHVADQAENASDGFRRLVSSR